MDIYIRTVATWWLLVLGMVVGIYFSNRANASDADTSTCATILVVTMLSVWAIIPIAWFV